MFKYSTRAEVTRKYYERRIRHFFDLIGFDLESKADLQKRCNNFAYKGRSEIKWATEQIIKFLQFQKDRTQKGEITAATLRNFVKSIKLFCEVSDISIPWKKITRGLPRARQAANDRAPTIEEIKKIVEYPDRRIKSIVYVMVSSGIRLGAWDYLKWKHVIPFTDEKGEIICAKLIVYAGDIEEYYSFMTAEAYSCLKEWMDFRACYGEHITSESWLMRDIWQTTNVRYGAKWGLATAPKRLNSSGIKRMIERALWEQGIRTAFKHKGQKRHEFKAAHGFRKFYKSRAEQVMKPINVEITMGHNIGVSESYYRPTEREVRDDYLKAVPLVSIDIDNQILQKQVKDLTEKSKDNEYTIKGILEEKDKQIQHLIDKQEEMERKFQMIFSKIDGTKLG
ncbi:MAG TPA: hypothetical protein VFI73_03890 [Candidatus Nitrosopolaris sp.]|nr:hypothetical protein [Candidatus Nitrosopolaris sp.]